MKITIKTLQQKVFQVRSASPVRCRRPTRPQIDADGEDTVGELKEKISEAHGHPVESQKLIYAGTLIGRSPSRLSHMVIR